MAVEEDSPGEPAARAPMRREWFEKNRQESPML